MATPIIPEFITVHLGTPDSDARNVTVPFPDYIKNVASSEIYPTWPENAIRANVYAQTTFALNRIYTEFYRSRGYNFDITNSTQFDQAFRYERDIFENVSRIVDELFNDYIVRQGQIQPFFSQYCNGTTVTCDGLSQWGTVPLANQGLLPYEILQRYYGDDINIVFNAPVRGNIPSYPGVLLRLGSAGEDVRTIQRQLNRIARNYPAIPKISNTNGIFERQTQEAVKAFQRIFNLDDDGIVGKLTWYKIKYIYNSVKGLSELYSEGITISESDRRYSTVVKRGDRGIPVETIQYYLNFLAYFNSRLTPVNVDGIFGEQTYDAVLTFQNQYSLEVDGIVGRSTWSKLQDAYAGVLRALPNEYKEYSSLIYPGYFITSGATGDAVFQVQRFINRIARYDSTVPPVDVDGVYGPKTQSSVKIIQSQAGLPQTGQVGPQTWLYMAELYDEYS